LIEMASVRLFPAAAALLAFLVVAVGAQPDDPLLSDPNVIPLYMSPGSPPTYVSC
jgi:hypothetical protein